LGVKRAGAFGVWGMGGSCRVLVLVLVVIMAELY